MVVALCQAAEVARRSDSHHSVYMPQSCAPHPHSSHLLAGFATGGQQRWWNITPPISSEVYFACVWPCLFQNLCFTVPFFGREGMDVTGFSLAG